MDLGGFEVRIVSDGTFRLDGGAMFGVVPKAIWGKLTESDEKNRIRLGLNCLLIRSDERNILIDTGCGSKFGEKGRNIYRISQETNVQRELARWGITPEEIDVVINTHLHFDHCGGNTERSGGLLRATFPRATYFVQRTEFEDANQPNERTQASYLQENWEVLLERGRLELLDGRREIFPGITCLPTPGHTRGHQSVRIQSEGKTVLFIADLCPTHLHVPLPWIMGYDHFPLTTLETRKVVYQEAVRGDWMVIFEHDAERPAGRLHFREGRWGADPVEWAD